MAQLPPELFARRGVCFIVGQPISSGSEIAIERLHIIVGPAAVFVPLFTSEERAGEYANVAFGTTVSNYAPVFCDDLRRLGQLLDALAQKGCTHVVFNPEPGVTSFDIADVTGALHEHLFRPPPSNN